jgi:hypothetical protein
MSLDMVTCSPHQHVFGGRFSDLFPPQVLSQVQTEFQNTRTALSRRKVKTGERREKDNAKMVAQSFGMKHTRAGRTHTLLGLTIKQTLTPSPPTYFGPSGVCA